jgi:hypothetical protein
MGWIEYRPVKELKDGKWKGLPGIIIFTKKFFKDFGLLKALDNCLGYLKDKVKKGYKEAKRRLRDGLKYGTRTIGTLLQSLSGRLAGEKDRSVPMPIGGEVKSLPPPGSKLTLGPKLSEYERRQEISRKRAQAHAILEAAKAGLSETEIRSMLKSRGPP